MIHECIETEIDTIFEYIGNDYGKCLYIYIDLKKYALGNKNFNVWIQYNKQDQICAIITEYYGGIQIYSKQQNYIINEIVDFIKKKDPQVIFAIKPIIDKLKKELCKYKQETGIVGELSELTYMPNHNAYSASLSEIAEIVKIIADDEEIGKPYGFESLYEQFYERKQNKFGRNYILRNKKNHEIIGHAGTYAELPELAVIGGVITSIPYRGKGYSKGILSALCNELLYENKRVFSFYYIPSAKKMHSNIGFNQIEEWSKLSKL